jgi:hypothetical protein
MLKPRFEAPEDKDNLGKNPKKFDSKDHPFVPIEEVADPNVEAPDEDLMKREEEEKREQDEMDGRVAARAKIIEEKRREWKEQEEKEKEEQMKKFLENDKRDAA